MIRSNRSNTRRSLMRRRSLAFHEAVIDGREVLRTSIFKTYLYLCA